MSEPTPRSSALVGTAWRPWQRWAVRAVVLGCLLCSLSAAWALDPAPDQRLAGLMSRLATSGPDRLFVSGDKASLGLLGGRGYVLTLYVGNRRSYAPAEYLIVTRVDDRRFGELMPPPDPSGAITASIPLSPAELDRYLDRTGLVLDDLEAQCRARRSLRAASRTTPESRSPAMATPAGHPDER